MKEDSRDRARKTTGEFVKGGIFLNIYPDTDVFSLRCRALPTVEGHVTERLRKKVKVAGRAGEIFCG